jgi:circadian clock protein KaiB
MDDAHPALLRLHLFVAGNSSRSNQTVHTLRVLCDQRAPGRYQLEVIDIYQQPALARQAQIIATPTLIKLDPQPKKILIGSLAQTERVLAGLGLAA